MTKEIAVQDLIALVDDEDYEELSRYTWSKDRGRTTWYARREERGKKIYMHRMVIKDCLQTDHRDKNGLNNQKHNLRCGSHSQNQANRVIPQGENGSGYRGVRVKRGRWQAVIRIGGRSTSFGVYDTKIEAALVYDLAARKEYGEFATCNYPYEG